MSNFLQWNPNLVNQENDTQYAADSMRAGGAGDPAIFPSATANKLFYQLSTFVAAFAQALTNKGYVITDASLPNLAAQLANVITAVDMAPYLTNANAAATYQPLIGFQPVQQGGGAYQGTNKMYLGWDGTAPRIQVDATDQGEVAMRNWANSLFTPLSDFVLANPGGTAAYYKLPSGLILQCGEAGVGTATVVNLPIPFPNGFYQVTATNLGGSIGTMTCRTIGVQGNGNSSFKVWVYDQTGAAASTNISWIAIGY